MQDDGRTMWSGLTARAGLAALGLATALAAVALATGDAGGDVGSRGTVRGDVSKELGEEDRIGLDLVEGESLDLSLSADFVTSLAVFDPDGAPLDLGFAPAKKFVVSGWSVPRSGHYVVRIASADGGQGGYRLSAEGGYPKKVGVDTADEVTVDLWMPAGGRAAGNFKGASGDPYIAGVWGPQGDEIVSRVDGRRKRVKLKSFTASEGGLYQITVGGVGGASGKIVRKVRRATKTKLNLTNGLTAIGFEADGVGTLFQRRCTACHSWAATYPGVRARARQSYDRMRIGNMPKSAPRIVGDDLALVDQWIRTGMRR